MGVGAGLYMCDVVKKFTFAISSPDEFLSTQLIFYPYPTAQILCFTMLFNQLDTPKVPLPWGHVHIPHVIRVL